MAITLDRKQERVIGLEADAFDFDALFKQHWERLCRMLFNIVGDWDEAQDLALETFERLYRRPPRNTVHLSAWLFRVGTRLSFNALRARKRRDHYEYQAGEPSDAVTGSHHASPEPAAAMERLDERRRVREVLGGMKPRSAELLILRHSGLAYAEIAEVLEIAPASVGTLLARAEAEFEKLYRAQFMDDPGKSPLPPGSV